MFGCDGLECPVQSRQMEFHSDIQPPWILISQVLTVQNPFEAQLKHGRPQSLSNEAIEGFRLNCRIFFLTW